MQFFITNSEKEEVRGETADFRLFFFFFYQNSSHISGQKKILLLLQNTFSYIYFQQTNQEIDKLALPDSSIFIATN